MVFSELEVDTLDIDWFACDKSGNIGHFATAGKAFLPEGVILNKELNDDLIDYVDGLPIISSVTFYEESCNRIRKKYQSLWRNGGEEKYFNWAKETAERGIYAFDCDLLVEEKPCSYLLLAIPTNPLKISLLPNKYSLFLSKQVLYAGNFDDGLIKKSEFC